MNPRINFSHNWNGKLGCGIFTTIRKAGEKKISYYRSREGQVFDVFLNGKQHCTARLLDVIFDRFGSVPWLVLVMDVGIYGADKARDAFRRFRIVPDDNVLILVFERDYR